MTDLDPMDTGALHTAQGAADGRISSLVDFLYPAPARRNVPSILRWWEKRRLPYNLILGSTGALTTGVVVFFATIPPLGIPPPGVELLVPIAAFGAMANVCYTFGSIVEIVVHKMWGRGVLPVGPALYRIGLTFSVGLALVPALLILVIWVVRVLAVAVG